MCCWFIFIRSLCKPNIERHYFLEYETLNRPYISYLHRGHMDSKMHPRAWFIQNSVNFCSFKYTFFCGFVDHHDSVLQNNQRKQKHTRIARKREKNQHKINLFNIDENVEVFFCSGTCSSLLKIRINNEKRLANRHSELKYLFIFSVEFLSLANLQKTSNTCASSQYQKEKETKFNKYEYCYIEMMNKNTKIKQKLWLHHETYKPIEIIKSQKLSLYMNLQTCEYSYFIRKSHVKFDAYVSNLFLRISQLRIVICNIEMIVIYLLFNNFYVYIRVCYKTVS